MKLLAADLDAVCRRMRAERRVALAVHEKPDADALGAAAGMLDLFAQLGVDAELCVSEGELLPLGDVLLPAGRVRRGAPPSDAALYALDSGNPDRLALPSWGDVAVNIDHHHDNPRYGELAFVRGEASSTSESSSCATSPARSSCGLAARSRGPVRGHLVRHRPLPPRQHKSPSTFRTAAWLVELGVDVTGMYALLYESRTEASLRLWARAVAGATVARRRARAPCRGDA